MKALKLLYKIKEAYDWKVEEAIEELEELEYRSCESCKECIYLGVDTDICLKCSHSYASKFKRIDNESNRK